MQYDRRILVTDASDGIGGAACKPFAWQAQADGASLALAITTSERNPAPQPLIEQLQTLGATVLHLSGDLADPDVCTSVAESALEFCGGLDVFVSNAGGIAPDALASMSLES